MQLISTGTYEIGYGGVLYEIRDGDLSVGDSDDFRDMAYVLHFRLYADKDPAVFKKWLEDESKTVYGRDDISGTIKYMRQDFESFESFDWSLDDYDENEKRRATADYVLFERDEDIAHELDILGVICFGLDDTDITFRDPSIADEFFAKTTDAEIQTATAMFRLLHDDGLADEKRREYEKLLRRRVKTAVRLAAKGDRAHYMRLLLDCGAVNAKNLYMDELDMLPKQCAEVFRPFKENIEREREAAKNKFAAAKNDETLERVELLRLWEPDVLTQIRNSCDDDKIITLKNDGTVVSEYNQLSEWKDVTQLYCTAGVICGLTGEGSILTHRTIEHPNAIAIETTLNGWKDIVSMASNGYECEFNQYYNVKPEDVFCVGLKKDGSVVSCGKKLNGESVAATWHNAKQAFADKASFGVVNHDGTISAFGRLKPLQELHDVVECCDNIGHIDWHSFILKDGTAVIFENKNTIHQDIIGYSPFGRSQWVALGEKGFETDHQFYGYKPIADGLGLSADGGYNEVRLRKFGMPVSYVHLYNPGTYVAAMAALYANGNVRLFSDKQKPGEIVAKKAVHIAAEGGSLVAYCNVK